MVHARKEAVCEEEAVDAIYGQHGEVYEPHHHIEAQVAQGELGLACAQVVAVRAGDAQARTERYGHYAAFEPPRFGIHHIGGIFRQACNWRQVDC